MRTRIFSFIVFAPFLLLSLAVAKSGNGMDATAAHKQYHGLSEQELIAKLGPPFKQVEKKRGEFQGEFYVILEKTYPLKKRSNYQIPIKEITWGKDDKKISCWLHKVNGQWQTFESFHWSTRTDY